MRSLRRRDAEAERRRYVAAYLLSLAVHLIVGAFFVIRALAPSGGTASERVGETVAITQDRPLVRSSTTSDVPAAAHRTPLAAASFSPQTSRAKPAAKRRTARPLAALVVPRVGKSKAPHRRARRLRPAHATKRRPELAKIVPDAPAAAQRIVALTPPITPEPTQLPATPQPTEAATPGPSVLPTSAATIVPTHTPRVYPAEASTSIPTAVATSAPMPAPAAAPTLRLPVRPTVAPTLAPTLRPVTPQPLPAATVAPAATARPTVAPVPTPATVPATAPPATAPATASATAPPIKAPPTNAAIAPAKLARPSSSPAPASGQILAARPSAAVSTAGHGASVTGSAPPERTSITGSSAANGGTAPAALDARPAADAPRPAPAGAQSGQRSTVSAPAVIANRPDAGPAPAGNANNGAIDKLNGRLNALLPQGDPVAYSSKHYTNTLDAAIEAVRSEYYAAAAPPPSVLARVLRVVRQHGSLLDHSVSIVYIVKRQRFFGIDICTGWKVETPEPGAKPQGGYTFGSCAGDEFTPPAGLPTPPPR